MAKHPAKCPRCGNRLEFDTAVDEQLLCPGCQVLLTFPGKFKASDNVDPLVGQKLGEFEIVEPIGRGGMGAVYKARQASLGRFVAVKILPRSVSRDANFIERFQREGRDAAAVNHPNIIQIHAVGQDKGFYYIAMELVDGESLADLLKRDGPLPADRVLEIFRQVTAALVDAHVHGIVHRDIKPANILLTSRGVAKLADFGLAKRSGVDVSVTHTGTAMGTPLYFAPESARGGQYDARSDLYSLGATFYHLLAGKPPFEGGNAIELAMSHAEKAVPPLKQLAPATPMALCEIVHRLLRKNPAERFQTAEELLQAIDRVEIGVGAALRGRPTRPEAAGPEGAHIGVPPAGFRARGRVDGSADASYPPAGAEARGREGAGGEPTRTMPGAGHASLIERRAVKARHRRKLFLLGGIGAAAAIVLVLVLVLGSSSPRPQATTPQPSPPSAKSVPPTPSPLPSKPETRNPAPLPSPAPKEGPPAAAWDAAWKEAESKAKALAAEQRFGDAAKVYAGLADLFGDLRLNDRAQKAVAALHEQADTAYADAERKARDALTAKKYDDARGALKPVLDRFGLPLKAEAAKKLMAEIEEAEKKGGTAKVTKDAKKEDEKGKEIDKAERERLDAEAKKRQEAEAAFTKALEPVEALVAAWDFAAAAASLPKVSTPSGGYSADLARRVATRRDELERLGKLHAKLIAKINATQPPLKRGSLYIPGTNADLIKADEKAITAQLPDGKTESHPWPSLSAKSVQNLVLRSIDRQSADDWLAGGILLLALKDASAAEKHFDKAKELGAAIDRYLDPLAAGAFAQAKDLLDKKQFPEADSALAGIGKKYAGTPWLAAHSDGVAAAKEAVRTGIAQGKAAAEEAEAEKLYSQAARHFERRDLFELKPIVEKLKADYPASKPVTDAARRPSFADMAKATSNLGRMLAVRKDGKGHFASLRDALLAAPPNSVIEIQDEGPYREGVLPIARSVVVRGKRGVWPVVDGPFFPEQSAPNDPDLRLERLVVVGRACYETPWRKFTLRIRSSIVACGNVVAARNWGCLGIVIQDSVVIAAKALDIAPTDISISDTVFLLTPLYLDGKATLSNVVALGLTAVLSCEMRGCTVSGPVSLDGDQSVMADSIVKQVTSVRAGVRIENCDIFGQVPREGLAKVGQGCFSRDPQFRDPANFDYRLKPTSPCRKRASDGGDIGCRYTSEMLEVLEKALELRKKGIIKF